MNKTRNPAGPKKPVTLRIDPDLHKQLSEVDYKAMGHRSKTALIETAITEHLNHENLRKS